MRRKADLNTSGAEDLKKRKNERDTENNRVLRSVQPKKKQEQVTNW